MSSPSHRARASSSARTAVVIARVKRTSWCMACTTKIDFLRSADASTLPINDHGAARAARSSPSAASPSARTSPGCTRSRTAPGRVGRSCTSRSNGDSSAVRPANRPPECVGVDPPHTRRALDLHRAPPASPTYPTNATTPSDRRRRSVRRRTGLSRRDRRGVSRVDPLGQSTPALPTGASGDGDLAASVRGTPASA